MRTAIAYRFRPFAALIMASALLVGCAGSTPTIDAGDDAAMTYDGLYPVKGGTADETFARPGADISRYSKIMLQSVGIEYRPGGESGRLTYGRAGAEHYEISDAQKQRLRAVVSEAFLAELGQSKHFTLVNEPGPDVLLVRGALLDVVSYVPPEPLGRGEIYLRTVGEATLVLELRDSVSEAIIARAVDRRAAEDTFGMSASNRVNNAAEVRRLARSWATLLRKRLDTFAELGE